MAKRERPAHVPIGVQLAVAERQISLSGFMPQYLLEIFPSSNWSACNWANPKSLSASRKLKIALRILFGEQTVNLDHNPALITRAYNPRIKDVAARYTPNANDPDYMAWRPKARDAERSHDIKTFVRGDNGQLSDIGLRNKQRRMDRNRGIIKSKRPKAKIKSRGFKKPVTKHKWASRPFKRKK